MTACWLEPCCTQPRKFTIILAVKMTAATKATYLLHQATTEEGNKELQ
jgi:hypothetical protein